MNLWTPNQEDPPFCNRCQKSQFNHSSTHSIWIHKFWMTEKILNNFPKLSEENIPILDGYKSILQNMSTI